MLCDPYTADEPTKTRSFLGPTSGKDYDIAVHAFRPSRTARKDRYVCKITCPNGFVIEMVSVFWTVDEALRAAEKEIVCEDAELQNID